MRAKRSRGNPPNGVFERDYHPSFCTAVWRIFCTSS